MNNYFFNWKECNEATANALVSGSEAPGQLWKFGPEFLPPNVSASMSRTGPVEFYVSGAVQPVGIRDGMTLLGEVAAIRYENTDAIPYRWLFAASGSGIDRKFFFGGFFKDFQPRHFTSGSLPVESVFAEPHPDWPSI
ncbi:MAG: hypothetical protein AB9869_09585 [Verrucomicrobiia bacterium]